MKKCAVVIAGILVIGSPLTVLSQEIISGEKWNEFIASSAGYINRSVTLEDTFGKINTDFNSIETGNNLTNRRHVKFALNQCPYPCIGLRSSPVMSGLTKIGPGDLVSVTGSLKTIKEKPPRISTTGKTKGGIKYKEKTRVYGAKRSEVYFDVGSVEKDWGSTDTFEQMVAEGKNLNDSDYLLVKPGESQLEKEIDIEKLVARAITFTGTYEGVDINFSDLEKAAGLSLENAIKFSVNTGKKSIACFIPFSDQVFEEFKDLAIGSRVQVFGRIRMKETPKGVLVGFVADSVDAVGEE